MPFAGKDCASVFRIVPTGGCNTGEGVFVSFSRSASSSSWRISASSCHLNSLLARLNSARAFPIWRPISGNFLGPKMMRANNEDEDHFRHAKIHRAIILPRLLERQTKSSCIS